MSLLRITVIAATPEALLRELRRKEEQLIELHDLQREKVTPSPKPVHRRRANTAWTPEDQRQLIELWPTNKVSTISAKLNRTSISIRTMAGKLREQGIFLALKRRGRPNKPTTSPIGLGTSYAPTSAILPPYQS